ncbi:MAG: HD domain-containing protein [Acidimicrobiales bacterium]
MRGYEGPATDTGQRGAFRTAHDSPSSFEIGRPPFDRRAREELEHETLAKGATRARGSGDRAVLEQPDQWRTCFERDRDRILHSAAWRRLAGKTQVFVFPADHQRTRLTHALEVAQVAGAIASACRLNLALTEAIALGHDCGHGPGGHASEDALSPFVEGGFDHAVWGADVTTCGLNLCKETIDGIRNHSWSRPAPATPEGEVVALADRIAYTAHDLEDAVRAGIVEPSTLPPLVRDLCGTTRSSQLRTFISDVVETTHRIGVIALSSDIADALAALRRFDYEHIYLRDASVEQSRRVIDMLQGLVEYFARRPGEIPQDAGHGLEGGACCARHGLAGGESATMAAVAYVAGMTDRYACSQAVARLEWSPRRLPRGGG